MKYTIIASVLFLAACSTQKPKIHCVADQDNDIVQALTSGYKIILHDTPLEAVSCAKEGEALMLLAYQYPHETLALNKEVFDQIKEKNLRAYIEFPSWLPGIEVQNTVHDTHKRAVVTSDIIGTEPDSLDILVVNGMKYCLVKAENPYLCAAKVAGFDEAVYGLPEKYDPLLFELPGYNILISTTCLSRPVKGRYAPRESWEAVWEYILYYIIPESENIRIKLLSDVAPMYAENEQLPDNYQEEAVKKGVEWYLNANMLPDKGTFDTIKTMESPHLLEWDQYRPSGDGSFGVAEAIMSVIDENGSQPLGVVQRGDCHGETALAFAAAGEILGSEKYLGIAENIIEYYLFKSEARREEWIDPDHGAYGLIPWGITNYAWYRANYGDDNARLLLGTLGTAAITGSDAWDDIAMKCLLAQLRTTGKKGFRGNRIDLPDFEKNGWEPYFNREIINIAPHFESWLWACFLWAYDKTAYPLFLEKAKSAIKITMDAYPDGWSWTNGLAQEKARILLCLAWLVRVEDTPEHREYLTMVAYDLITLQDECGAIREELGDLKMGKYPPPQSNDAYGTNEASLLGRNGDKVSDLLYTTNFAFLGLHEAAYATDDPRIIEASDKLAEFLCRIQVNSEIHPEIHGGWFRAFDYGRFEHWGCNADLGWGAWCIESGWTQGWITTVLALREMGISYWELTANSQLARSFDEILLEMKL